MIEISEKRDMLIYAFRYVLGRQTYAVSTVIDNILNNWESLSDGDKKLYQNEIREHKERFGFSIIDEPSWNRILKKEIN